MIKKITNCALLAFIFYFLGSLKISLAAPNLINRELSAHSKLFLQIKLDNIPLEIQSILFNLLQEIYFHVEKISTSNQPQTS